MTRSIRGRLLLLAAVWLTAALLGAFLVIAQLLEDFVTDRFDAETAAIADSLIGQLRSRMVASAWTIPPWMRVSGCRSRAGTGRSRRAMRWSSGRIWLLTAG